MRVSDSKVVYIHYILTNDQGEILDSSADSEPLAYIHGLGNIIPGLEKALTGKAAGERLNVSVAPEDAYGVRDDDLVQIVPRSAFSGIDELQPGMRFQTRSPEGVQIVTVTEVEEDQVTVDGNHPLAGQTLHFDVEVADIRSATEEELEHGHVHGPGGHHH